MPSASVSGWRNATRTSPLLSLPTCSADGFCTMTIASAWPTTASATDAPAASYSPSSKPADVPAPRSTATVKPAPTRREAMSGTRATRRSPGAVSFGTPTSMRRNSTRAAGALRAEGNGAESPGIPGRMPLMDLARAIEARDPYSSGHAARVTAIAEVVAARLGWDEEQIDVLRIGAALHDIGKVDVPDTRAPQARAAQRRRVRPRPGTPGEGARMLGSIGTWRAAVPCVLHHHERWDGSGYPTGTRRLGHPARGAGARRRRRLRRDDVGPAVPACAVEPRAVAELERCAGTQFDPEVVAVFAEAWRQGAFEMPADIRIASL